MRLPQKIPGKHRQHQRLIEGGGPTRFAMGKAQEAVRTGPGGLHFFGIDHLAGARTVSRGNPQGQEHEE